MCVSCACADRECYPCFRTLPLTHTADAKNLRTIERKRRFEWFELRSFYSNDPDATVHARTSNVRTDPQVSVLLLKFFPLPDSSSTANKQLHADSSRAPNINFPSASRLSLTLSSAVGNPDANAGHTSYLYCGPLLAGRFGVPSLCCLLWTRMGCMRARWGLLCLRRVPIATRRAFCAQTTAL